jgi:hypothetical protein
MYPFGESYTIIQKPSIFLDVWLHYLIITHLCEVLLYFNR